MIQLHFEVKQLKILKTMGVLHSFVWNFVKYANMEGFHRDSHICYVISKYTKATKSQPKFKKIQNPMAYQL